jgi:hypothetical protein
MNASGSAFVSPLPTITAHDLKTCDRFTASPAYFSFPAIEINVRRSAAEVPDFTKNEESMQGRRL